MDIYKSAVLIVLLMLLPGCENEQAAPPATGETAVEHAVKHLDPKYICPMHPQIIRDAPSRCPLCGMDLVKQKLESLAEEMPVVSLDAGVIQKLGVRTEAVTKGQLWKFIKTVGYVGYNERRLKHMRSRTTGWVENLAVRTEGRKVKKGQLLLEIYSPEFLAVQKDFLEAQKKDQSGTLKKYGQREESVGPRDYMRYLEVPDSAANEIARIGKVKHRIPVYAPQHGTLVRHNLHKHMYLTPGFPMFTIADMSSVWVEADVFEHQLEWVTRGLTADIEVQALPGRVWQAQLVYIYPELDPKTRTLKVRLLVPNPDELLKPNMFAQVKIYGGPKQDVLKIPREALIVTGEREAVVKDLGDGRYQPVDVVAGMRSQGEVEILSGLEEGDRIVVSGQFLIDSEANLQASFRRFASEQQ